MKDETTVPLFRTVPADASETPNVSPVTAAAISSVTSQKKA